MFSLMALTWDPLYEHLSKGFMGQPCFQVLDHWFGRRVWREGSNHEKSCAGRPGTSRQACLLLGFDIEYCNKEKHFLDSSSVGTHSLFSRHALCGAT